MLIRYSLEAIDETSCKLIIMGQDIAEYGVAI